jgi:transposase
MSKGGLPPQVELHSPEEYCVGIQGIWPQGPRLVETAMTNDILLCVDYHDEKSVIRRLDQRTGIEQLLTVPTDPQRFTEVVAQAQAQLGRRRSGQVVWIQESTTGWARVQALLAARQRVRFVLANVVQMPLPPQARRRKTDKIDTARIQREYLNGELPQAHQPAAWWRQVRRLVAMRENLVRRQTALRNWINRYLAHETWASRANLWSGKGQQRLRGLLTTLPASDRQIIDWKLDELARLRQQRVALDQELWQRHQGWPEAQRIDAIKGISVAAAVSIAARIGPVERFADAEQLIAYAGLAPGVQQSDQTRHDGRIGGGGTDKQLRHYLIEASIWARQLPRYQKSYERTAARRGKKIGRLVVARMMLRSIYKMLRDGVAFAADVAMTDA